MEKLIAIQGKLKCNKSQHNSFGNYNYRSCEDILEAVKPMCVGADLLLVITDEVVEIGGRVYVKATVTVSDGLKEISASAYAREPESQKGMSVSQITGAASSYARKYALNGMFAIDDTKDADASAPEKHSPQEVVEYIDEKQLSELMDCITEKKVDTKKLLNICKAESLEKFPKSEFDRAMKLIADKK